MKKLLVLEDEVSVLNLLRQVLQQYDLVEATTAEEALRAFTDHPRQIDLLLTDVTLPTSSGIQVALLLRSSQHDLPVILMSGYPVGNWDRNDAADLARLGSDSVVILQKPFRSEALTNAVSDLLESGLGRKAPGPKPTPGRRPRSVDGW